MFSRKRTRNTGRVDTMNRPIYDSGAPDVQPAQKRPQQGTARNVQQDFAPAHTGNVLPQSPYGNHDGSHFEGSHHPAPQQDSSRSMQNDPFDDFLDTIKSNTEKRKKEQRNSTGSDLADELFARFDLDKQMEHDPLLASMGREHVFSFTDDTRYLNYIDDPIFSDDYDYDMGGGFSMYHKKEAIYNQTIQLSNHLDERFDAMKKFFSHKGDPVTALLISEKDSHGRLIGNVGRVDFDDFAHRPYIYLKNMKNNDEPFHQEWSMRSGKLRVEQTSGYSGDTRTFEISALRHTESTMGPASQVPMIEGDF